jgi:hypothetical protein
MQHGHTLKLVPDPLLIGIPSGFPLSLAALADEDVLADNVVSALQAINSEAIRHRVDRYAGAANLADGMPVLSRHLAHPDNRRAVDAIAEANPRYHQRDEKGRCRLHGGANGSGGPPGERNGQYRHGDRAKAAIAEQRKASALLNMLRAGLTNT